jgi:hypothetical protein
MTFCDVTIPDYAPRNCGTDFAGIIGLGIINVYEEPTTSELEDPDYWANRLTEVTLKYFAIRNTRGQYEEIEVQEEEDLIGSIVTGAKHTAVIEVPDIQDNRDFWDAIQRHNWKICLVTSGGLMYYIDKPVSVYAKLNNQKSIKQQAFFEVHLKWYDFSNPYILEAPEGIFTGTMPLVDEGIFDYTFDYTFG